MLNFGQGGATIPLPNGTLFSLNSVQVERITKTAPPDVKFVLLASIAGVPLRDGDCHMVALYFQQRAAAIYEATNEA